MAKTEAVKVGAQSPTRPKSSQPAITTWLPHPDVRRRSIVGKTILLNIKNNRLLVLDKQATAIWSKLTISRWQSELCIVGVLQKEYKGVSPKKLQEDVHSLLSDLEERGFVHSRDAHHKPRTPSSDKKPSSSGHFSFSESLHIQATKRNVPISGGLEITQRCHLRCVHCYIDNQPVVYHKELSTAEMICLLGQLAESGCLWLLITGGEPLLRGDFSEIYQEAKELGMIITVFTSATNLTEEVADLLAEYPPFLVEATLHGSSETTFDGISGVPGSFLRFQNGLTLLRERGVPFHLKMVMMKQNVHEVEAASRLAYELGAEDFRFDPMVNADFSHSSKAEGLRISVEEALGLDLLEPYRSRWKKVYRTAKSKQAADQTSEALLFPCRAGKCSFTVSADGQLLPCVLMRTPSYDLRRVTFSEAWAELNRYANTTRMRSDNPCLGCAVELCSKCPAWGSLEHGDPNAKSRFACALEQKREQIFR